MSNSQHMEELLCHGIVYFSGVVTQESMEILAAKLLKLDLDKNFESPVLLYINSCGGDLAAAMGVIEVIGNMRLPVDTYGIGEICSAGLLLFLAGEHRYITPTTDVLSHQYAWGKGGKHHELKANRKAEDILMKKLIKYYRERTGLKESVIKTKLLPASDVWLSAEEAFKYNIATTIIKGRRILKTKDITAKKTKNLKKVTKGE
jgi:ATP-dependent Clp endopeptidase proteolytic subunit ClpP